MQANKNILTFVVLSVLLFSLAGCLDYTKTDNSAVTPESSKNGTEASTNKFINTAEKERTAVDSAIELAQKCETYSKQILDLRQEKQDLTTENEKLKEKIAIIEPELAQTKKELNEANDLLLEMRLELNNWKVDILGYRDEMRQANKAQLEALLKILTVLGGETVQPQPKDIEKEKK